MEDALWKLSGFILSAILLFAIPTMSLLERQDDITRAVVQAETNRFADTARDMGYISAEQYERFNNRLKATGLIYDIRIRHERRSWQPVYLTTANGLVFTGEYRQSRITEGENSVLSAIYSVDSESTLSDGIEGGRYFLNAGDMLIVEAQSRGKTMAASWRSIFLTSAGSGMGIFARAGGMVRNEAD